MNDFIAEELLREGAAGCRGYATMLYFSGIEEQEEEAKVWREKANRIDAFLAAPQEKP